MPVVASSTPDPADLSFGQYLAALRVDRNMSREVLADRGGVSRVHVYRLESGLVTEPRPALLQRLVVALDLSAVERRVLLELAQPAKQPIARKELMSRDVWDSADVASYLRIGVHGFLYQYRKYPTRFPAPISLRPLRWFRDAWRGRTRLRLEPTRKR